LLIENTYLIKESFSNILIGLHKQISFFMVKKKLEDQRVLINNLLNVSKSIESKLANEEFISSLHLITGKFSCLIDYFCNVDVFKEASSQLNSEDFPEGEFFEDLETYVVDKVILKVLADILFKNEKMLKAYLVAVQKFLKSYEGFL